MATTGGPLPPYINNGPTFLTVIGVFTALSLGLCIARIWTRLRARHSLRVDDYFIIVGTVLCTAFYCTTSVGIAHGWGKHSAYVSAPNRIVAMKSMFSAMTMWILACALIRVSIAISLLRLSIDRKWRGGLWFMIIAQVVLYIVFMVFHLFGCRPLRASWEPVYDVRCWPRKHVLYFGYVSSGMLTAIDFTLAMMPIILIRHLNRRTSEKILICFMMSLGLGAGAIASYKISISDETFRGDLMASTVPLAMWNELEALLGIVAACVPCLKSPGEKILLKLGWLAGGEKMGMTKPSFVLSLQDHGNAAGGHDGNDLHQSSSVPSSGGSGKESAMVVEVDKSVP